MKFNVSVSLLRGLVLLAFTTPLSLAAQNTPKPDLKVEADGNPVVEDPAPLAPDTLPPLIVETPAPPKPLMPEPTIPKPVKRTGPVDSLKPGQYIFEKHDSYDGALRIVAVLDIQRMYVFLDDKLIAFTTISAGKKGKETPTGNFNILQKNIDHKSNIYSNAPMPYMQRLTWDGIALHAGKIPGYAASHGCIRLPLAFAKSLYGITKMGQEVVVLRDTNSKPKKIEPPVQVVPPVTAPEQVPPPAPII